MQTAPSHSALKGAGKPASSKKRTGDRAGFSVYKGVGRGDCFTGGRKGRERGGSGRTGGDKE